MRWMISKLSEGCSNRVFMPRQPSRIKRLFSRRAFLEVANARSSLMSGLVADVIF